VSTVRPLVFSDRPEWERLWRGYLAFYRADLPVKVTEGTWARLIDPAVDMHAIGAEGEGGRLIGICHYLFHPATWTLGPYCYLEDLFVDPGARGGGAGRALIEAVYEAADERGAGRVYWLTEEGNRTARRLYDRIGRHSGFIQYRR
jgi:GNAT superfamily N-acetyltransferase